MAKRNSKSTFTVGTCKVEVEGDVEYEQQRKDELQLSLPAAAKFKISVDKPRRYATRRSRKENLSNLQLEEGEGLPAGFSFVCVNPKDANAQTKVLLEEVLQLYAKELPMMSYAANTGKESPFVEKCVTGGKYCSLLLKSDAIVGTEEVIAAITYQIVPSDTQYAEIPLASVSRDYQHKGFGRVLYEEVKKRLQDVGVLTLFCWGDEESEGFWIKQGFSTVAEVDGKGKARKLPIKTDIRKAMSMPGSATLLVAHLNRDKYISGNSGSLTPPRFTRPCMFLAPCTDNSKSNTKASPTLHVTTPIVTETKTSFIKLSPKKRCLEESMLPNCKSSVMMDINQSPPKGKVNTSSAQVCFRDDGMGTPTVPSDIPGKVGLPGSTAEAANSDNIKNFNDSVLDACNKQEMQVKTPFLPQRGIKRRCSDAQAYCNPMHISEDNTSNDTMLAEHKHSFLSACENKGGSVGTSTALCILREPLVEVCTSKIQDPNLQQKVLDTEKATSCNLLEASTAGLHEHVIMLMNMADERKRIQLTKIVEKLGGSVSSVGNICTHVVTGQVRRTLNFCTALCVGAWVVSPDWLKASFRENKFVDEMPFILKDQFFELKYGVKLEDVVLHAHANPQKLLNGFHVYITPNVQPPVEALSAIVKSAGGEVLLSLEKAQDLSHTFALTCGEDMSEALAAAMTGMATFSCEWFMCSIMKQNLDLNAPQFTESLQ